MKQKQPRSRCELGLSVPFPTTITVTLRPSTMCHVHEILSKILTTVTMKQSLTLEIVSIVFFEAFSTQKITAKFALHSVRVYCSNSLKYLVEYRLCVCLCVCTCACMCAYVCLFVLARVPHKTMSVKQPLLPTLKKFLYCRL